MEHLPGLMLAAICMRLTWRPLLLICRYVGTMKKGSPAADTVRAAAGALWGKGAALTWKLPAGAAKHAPMTGDQSSLLGPP